MTYSELVTAIKGYTENSFPSSQDMTSTAQINTFIKNAEIRIYNTVQMPQFKKNVAGSLTSGNKYLSLPDDFLAVYSLAVYTTPALGASSPKAFLLDKDVSFIRETYPDPTYGGEPEYYALFGTNSTFPFAGSTFDNLKAITILKEFANFFHFVAFPLNRISPTTVFPPSNCP